jgi:hypothetical protein
VSETVNIGPTAGAATARPENDARCALGLRRLDDVRQGAGDATIPALFDQRTTGWRVRNYGQTDTRRQMLEVLENQLQASYPRRLTTATTDLTHCNYAVTLARPWPSRSCAERSLRSLGYRDELVTPLVRRVRRVLGSDRQVKDEWACDRDPARAEQVAETLVRNWELARLLVERWGGRFHAFLQPVAYVGSPRLDHLEIDHAGEGAQFRAVYPLIRAKLAERGASWASDLSAAFDGDAYLYIDDCHVSPRGNEIIASAMLAAIGERGVESPARAER